MGRLLVCYARFSEMRAGDAGRKNAQNLLAAINALSGC